MQDHLLFKELIPSDLPALAELFAEAFREEPWKEEWSREMAEERIRSVLEARGFYGLGAYEGEELCGFILGWTIPFCKDLEFEMREFAVKNQKKGAGIGSRLCKELERRLKEKQIKKLSLITLDQELTRHFYEKNGFQKSESMILMEKQIGKNSGLT